EESNLGASVLQADPAPCRLGFRQRRAPPMGFEPTAFPVTGERPLRAGLRRRLSCRGGTRTHGDRLIRAVPCRLATPQCRSPGCQRSIEPSTPCGSRTRLCGLKDRRPPPQVQRGIRAATKANRPGVAPTPGRRLPLLAHGGYPLVSQAHRPPSSSPARRTLFAATAAARP